MQTLTQKIIETHAKADAIDGSAYVTVEPDLVLGHEATIALLIGRLKKAGLPVYDPSRCFFAADHFVPPATAERADILNQYVAFVREQGISSELFYKGISHQLLVEDSRCRPGAFIAGADSHTTMGGALGAFSAGFGSTDILAILATGQVYVKVPDAIALRFFGQATKALAGKDLALEMMRLLGEGGGRYHALEFYDDGAQISMASRCTLTNMAVDCGAKNGIFIPDKITKQYMEARDSMPIDMGKWLLPDPNADYVKTITIDVSKLSPLVARPGSPADVVPAESIDSESIDQVFIGSCCGGRLEDLHEAAAVLRGKTVTPGVRLVVTPASQNVYKAAVKDGTIETLIDAGAIVTATSCGACGGIDKGLLGPTEVCVSTSNRNFRGRMGHPDSRVFLASARTAAASALTGRVVDPREVA